MTRTGDKLVTYWQLRQIETLLRRIGIPASTDGLHALQAKAGGSSQPYAYRLMSRSQAANFIEALWDFVRERERATDVHQIS
jgi:hypothetical protein